MERISLLVNFSMLNILIVLSGCGFTTTETKTETSIHEDYGYYTDSSDEKKPHDDVDHRARTSGIITKLSDGEIRLGAMYENTYNIITSGGLTNNYGVGPAACKGSCCAGATVNVGVGQQPGVGGTMQVSCNY